MGVNETRGTRLEQAFRHILILDKSATERYAARRSIAKYSGQAIEFTEFDCEKQALAFLREHETDCLLLDFYLGDHTGADFLDQVRANLGALPCPVVMITGGLSSGHDVLLSLRAGAHDYIDSIRILDPCLWKSMLYARSRYEITEELLSRTNELSRLNRELTLKNRLKTQFLANATHELRTPLSAISGIVELAKQESDPSLLHRYLETIDSCCNSLMHCVDDVLDLTRIEMGDFHLSRDPFELKEVLKEVEMSLTLPAMRRNPELQVEIPSEGPLLRGDARRLKQILTNLVGNALRHTPEGRITIRSRCLRKLQESEKCEYLFEVEDTGFGIPEDDLPHLFERHYQAVNSRSESGSGLGLALVKDIVERMNGEVGCRSSLGQGSTFWFRLPFQVEKEKPSVTPQIGPDKPVVRILVAEDNPVLANVIRQQLKNLGCEVVVAKDGVEAVELFPSGGFHLLILDARMPRLGGLDACRQIRDKFATTVPIVLLTADSGLPNHDLNRYGLTRAFVKPLPEEKLRTEMLSLVNLA